MICLSLRLNLVFIVAWNLSLTVEHTTAAKLLETQNFTDLQYPQIFRINIHNLRRNSSIKENYAEGTKITGHKPRYFGTERPKITADDSPFSQPPSNDWSPKNNDRSIASHHLAKHGVSHTHRNRSLNRTKSFSSPVEVNSGLNLRLIGNNRVNKGIIEVKINNRWGYICKDGLWNKADARVVCRQLGFSSAKDNVLSTKQTKRIDARKSFVMSQVRCRGVEDEIQNCTYNTTAFCSSSRAVGVHCAPNPGCDRGWLAANGFCYKLIKTKATFYEAQAGCHSRESFLLRIDTQKESNFISSLLVAERAKGAIWTSGHRIDQNGLEEWRWLGSSYAIQFTKWFPGHLSAKLRSQPNVRGNQSCIALSKTFQDINNISHDVIYYFWTVFSCVQKLDYICKKIMQVNDCYEEKGSNYRGTVFITARAALCQKWTESSIINPSTHQNAGLGDHNYCRNPDGDERPWCWINAAQRRFGYCELSPCPRRDPSPPIPSNCVEEREVQCAGRNGQICIPLTYICDKEWDCSDGADEANCTYFEVSLANGSRTEGRVQITINNITGTVCDDDWDDKDATVVCRMLGHSTGTALAVTGAQFGQGRGPIWLDNLDCAGHESGIEKCDHPAWGEHNCMHSEDAGVSCVTSGRTYTQNITYSYVVWDCGRRPIHQPQAKIIGGQHTVYGAYPWQARIMKRNMLGEFVHSCGGTIIDLQWVLSAAHCFEPSRLELFRVRIGDYRSDTVEIYEQEFAVSRLFIHSRYLNIIFMYFGYARYDYDIALVKLQPIGSQMGMRYSSYVQPACLPTALAEYAPGLLCEVSGWGLSEQNASDVLMSAILPIKEQSECQNFYSHRLSRKMFCAGYRDGRADTCQGDSGGPLVCQVNGTYTVMGITSWGLGCGTRDSPGVYTKVGEFTDWILQTIRNNS